MADERDDGGSAFPTRKPILVWNGTDYDERPDKGFYPGATSGMSLRDWFAGQAIAGHLDQNDGDRTAEALASFAYELADAMLKERSR